ncbi:MAG: hypothetical protein RLZZ450_4472 [Pseudomonadota bacterium]|jgi:hypothetical protein
MLFALRAVFLLALFVMTACGDDDVPVARVTTLLDASTDAASATAPAADAGPSAQPPANGRSPVITIDVQRPREPLPITENESFETALVLVPGTARLQDVLHFAQDNYFTFEAKAGDFVDLRTSAHTFSPDVKLRLYDPQRTLIAENDNGSLWPGDDVDARLVVRLPTAGRYFVKVTDDQTRREYFSRDTFSLLYYRLDLRVIAPGAEGFVFADHAGQPDVHFALDATSGYSYVTLVGTLEASHLDSFVFAGLENQIVVGHLLGAGLTSPASPAPVDMLRVSSGDQHVLAEVAGALGATKFYPPITTGKNLVTIAAPRTVGENGYYAVDLVMLPDNPREQHEVENGLLAGAEPLMLKSAGRGRALLLADVPFGEVDYYSLTVARGAQLLVSCEGQSAASGVRKLHAEIRDDKDQTLGVLTESPSHELDIEAFRVPAAGNYYLRLFSDPEPGPQSVEAWVRCVILIG